MKIRSKPPGQGSLAFTLIEMIGVLAVIAILAALLVPKIFESINNARVNNAAVSYNTVKTAVMDHYAKFGFLAVSNGATLMLPETAFDKILVSEGFMDKPFVVKIGDGITNRVEAVQGGITNTAVTVSSASYDLDGVGGTAINDTPGAVVVQAVITGVAEADARDLSERIDGPTLSAAAIGTDDLKGRVKYATGSPTTVYMYISHR